MSVQSNGNIFIIGAARTGIGDFGGGLKDVPPTSLGTTVVRAAIERAHVEPSDVQHVVMGAGNPDRTQGRLSCARRRHRCWHSYKCAGAEAKSPMWLRTASDHLRWSDDRPGRDRLCCRRRRRKYEQVTAHGARRAVGQVCSLDDVKHTIVVNRG